LRNTADEKSYRAKSIRNLPQSVNENPDLAAAVFEAIAWDGSGD